MQLNFQWEVHSILPMEEYGAEHKRKCFFDKLWNGN